LAHSHWHTGVRVAIAAGCVAVLGASCSTGPPPLPAALPLKVTWMPGFAAPGTPARYDEVGVIKVGTVAAKNVLVLEPGTSAASAYFVPLAKWIVAEAPGWQVWSVERRENLLEDQSELNLAKRGRATATQLFDYYFGYLKNPTITNHVEALPDTTVAFAKQWGMQVAVEDLHDVITAAKRRGGRVVLGGHSLGGSVVTAYATWDFGGRAGADDLSGLVYIDGGSSSAAETAQDATAQLDALDTTGTSPWLAFGGITAPYAGLFTAAGSLSALLWPNSPSLGQSSGLLTPFHLSPSVPVTNLAQFGYALNVATSLPSLLAAQAHLGQGLSPRGPVHGWNSAGALTPIKRFATMFSGFGINDVDGTEWYFPQRLTDDTAAVGNGIDNPAQSVLELHATMGRDLPKRLRIYAFGARLGGEAVLEAAQQLAAQSSIPSRNLTLVNRQSTYAHNDPAGAFPHNAFFGHLVPFLKKISASPLP
jgi:pimeloyl-ACP methyl ester carboxylesterase